METLREELIEAKVLKTLLEEALKEGYKFAFSENDTPLCDVLINWDDVTKTKRLALNGLGFEHWIITAIEKHSKGDLAYIDLPAHNWIWDLKEELESVIEDIEEWGK